MGKVVLSTVKLPEDSLKALSNLAEVYELPNLSERGLEEVVPRVNVLMCWCSREFDLAKWISRMANLEVIQTFSAGVDHLPYGVIPGKVRIFSNAGAYSEPVAEHAWAMILALAKGVYSRTMDRHTYLNDPAYSPRRITGANLLVLGTGGIGREVARIGKLAFRMHTIGVNRSGRPVEYFDEVYPSSRLREALPKGDVVVIALPLNKYTRRLIGRQELELLPRGAIVVNVGRGDVVDEEALYEFLSRRRDVRFGTDVFWDYGQGESFTTKTPLLSLPNFLGTPHVAGGAQREVAENAVRIAVNNVLRYLRGEAPLNEVDRSDYI